MVTLYDDRPVPKVIDFGVAKAIEQQLTEKSMFTHFGQVVGTLDYMSPEQAKMNQLGIDTRSDIYSLGVLLYELLTGSTPLTASGSEWRRLTKCCGIIREEEPPLPSLGLSSSHSLPSISANRHMEPQAHQAGSRRVGLDRDEGPGEGPHPALRNRQRLRGRHPAPLERRAGRGLPAIGRVPIPEIRAAEQGWPPMGLMALVAPAWRLSGPWRAAWAGPPRQVGTGKRSRRSESGRVDPR